MKPSIYNQPQVSPLIRNTLQGFVKSKLCQTVSFFPLWSSA